jgi:hypothetical protein
LEAAQQAVAKLGGYQDVRVEQDTYTGYYYVSAIEPLSRREVVLCADGFMR